METETKYYSNGYTLYYKFVGNQRLASICESVATCKNIQVENHPTIYTEKEMSVFKEITREEFMEIYRRVAKSIENNI